MSTFLECGPFTARTGDGRLLFEDVSVALSDSQFVCVEGPSGSGKSTLLRHITALAWSSKPQRHLEGRSYGGVQLSAWRSKVCLIAQDAPMLKGSVGDNLMFPFLQRAGRGMPYDGQEAQRLLSAVGLAELPTDRDIKLLSGGERHRVALVRGLLWNPPVLVADEVLAGLDPESAQACLELLSEYARRSRRLLICVLHDPEICERADLRLRLRDGSLEDS
jgi:putative ABC transport system ATP-binding protein